MAIPVGDGVFSSTWLSSVLEGANEWPHGSVRVRSTMRIGAEHGLSGRIHRVTVETERGGQRSIVVKQETAAAVVLEDISPAEQGDVLHGCTADQAGAVIRVLARLHGGSASVVDGPGEADLPRWTAHPMESERWRNRLGRASERFPEILGPRVLSLLDLPESVVDTGRVLREEQSSWLQVDAHLDNTLFRPDGAVVLLDWCNAAIGPPVLDLARFLIEGVVEPTRRYRVTALLSLYRDELRRLGVGHVSVGELESGFELVLLPLLQGAIGWAGRDDLELGTRASTVCESFLRSMCGWVLGDDPGSKRESKVL